VKSPEFLWDGIRHIVILMNDERTQGGIGLARVRRKVRVWLVAVGSLALGEISEGVGKESSERDGFPCEEKL